MADERAELLRALHDEHGPLLWRYVVRLTHDTALADDVVQETLLRAWRRPRLLDQTEGSARAWLFTVARRRGLDALFLLREETGLRAVSVGRLFGGLDR